ncbi:MAG: hypothetical protein PHT07_09910 [Paludibacter sp.]|nr:hypothetical protein [Paludibacter sp.]
MNLLYIFLLLDSNLYPSKATFGMPHNITQDVPDDISVFVLSAFVIFAIYVGIRVWLSLRKDKLNNKKI